MDLDELRALFALYEHGSMSAAADASGVPRSTLRRRVEELEARIGTPLRGREGEQVAPTAAGELLLARGRALLRDYEALLRPPAPERAPLRIASPNAAMAQPLALALLRRGVVVQLAGGHASLRIGEPGPGDLPLGHYEEGAFAAPDYLDRRGAPADRAALREHTLLGGPDPDAAWPTPDGDPWPVRLALACPDLALLERAVRSGLGIGLLPRTAAAGLARVLPDQLGSRLRLHLRITGPVDPALAEALLDAARELDGP